MFMITLEINIGNREYKFLTMHSEMNLKIHYPKGCSLSSYVVKIPFFWYVESLRVVETATFTELPVFSHLMD